ncbi:ParB/Srx family N-terminal domain-containing protein [Citrobacter freundii]|uniref:ParB/Srx family N-terminal domain-containing protein n=1 Tax=Enterobacteriaceae TaxID=543 RepID=UPI00043563CC|nr:MULTISPECIES: ParB/Srx family N-terminal domain-containing protein [Enterobacteriaceae]EDT0013518.1 hypothetical protein [Salmonella enterica]ELI9011310.1 hypothetical protein [Klebsiella aerogenes]MCW1434769.1 ParB/Srx family N-terminal domain-containing protein [Citrobacter freundii]EGB4547417.1 hypothetical protein [Salmonella enterica]EJP2096746.1 hypothetical protein [Salmonella enterica]
MSNEIRYINTEELDFDPENPRFYRLNDRAGSENAVIEEMLDDESVQDLMLSIGEQDYFPGEPLLVVSSGKKYVVVEGNRRLAAVKLLNSELLPPKRKEKSVQLIQDEATYKPTRLPCLVYKKREDVLRYIGYRHITGVKEWDALSKAKYLKELSETFYQGADKESLLKSLAKEIGSKSYYVGLLLTALKLYETAADKNFYNLPMNENDVDFSYITTALGYTNITDWLGLDDRKDLSAENLKEENLEKIFAWFFVRDQQGDTIIGESRKIKDLSTIVANEAAVDNLIKSKNIEEAYLYTNGHEEALDQALDQAESRLRIVWDMLLNTNSFTENHEYRSGEILSIARKIKKQIESIREEDE